MPRYFFHVRDYHLTIYDSVGDDLPDLEAALGKAAAFARGLVAEGALRGAPLPNRWFEITDEAGIVVTEVQFRHLLDDGPSVA